MRIVTWNCNGAFGRKLPAILAWEPDLLVIQEASERDILALNEPFAHWVGRGHKGLAVIGRRELGYRLDPSFDPDLPWFLPVHVGSIRLLAVWASVLTNRLRYVRLMHAAIDRYAAFLDTPNGLIAGDFNSNTVFDRKHGRLTHTTLVDRLANLGYTSLWHHQHVERHGEESRPTFYLYRRRDRTWHLDYAFLGSNLLPDARITLGPPEDWLGLSDHLPLLVEIDQPLCDARPSLLAPGTKWNPQGDCP
jgi:exonuclease III